MLSMSFKDHHKTTDSLLKELKIVKAELAVMKEEAQKRKLAEERIFFLQEIMEEIIEANNFNEAINITLKLLCQKTEWAFGQMWFSTNENALLELSPIWYSQDDKLKIFRKSSKEHEAETYPGFLRKAWKTKNPIWIQDISEEEGFPRKEEAQELGIKAALAVPIIYKDKVIAIMEFFMLKSSERDISFIGLILAIATQIGGLLNLKQFHPPETTLS